MTTIDPALTQAKIDVLLGISDDADAPKSSVGHLAGLGPINPVDSADPYPRPWHVCWDAPVWRVLSQNRTVVCTTSDEAVAKLIVKWSST